jgi:predicted RNase H-like HicB family nuclease
MGDEPFRPPFCNHSVAYPGTMLVMKWEFAATVWREGNWYVSQCLEVDVASQGETEEEALANLKEALELHFEPPLATRPPKVRTIEVEVGAA